MSHKPDPNKNVNLFIDEVPVTVPEGTTILEAARRANIKIPVLCDHPALGKRAVCRICVVECDGRGKLLAACSQDVWEGVHVVTHSKRLNMIRKTILELILADHPQECLGCVRSTNCELQTLAGIYNDRHIHNDHNPFHQEKHRIEQRSESAAMTLTRDMRKCVKCGRCVEACQKVQSAGAINTGHRGMHYEICTPYMQPLEAGPCVYCGLCAQVCPVGAIVEYDQTAQAQETLGNKEYISVTKVSAEIAAVIGKEFGLPEGTITKGKLVTALKMLGFEKVYDADIAEKFFINEINKELIERTSKDKQQDNLPMITGCSPAVNNFISTFYPELAGHLCANSSPEQHFGQLVKTAHNKNTGEQPQKIMNVSFVPCIAKKFEAQVSAQRTGTGKDPFLNVDLALTRKELARMIRMAGIELETLPETPFDCMNMENQDAPCPKSETTLEKIFTACACESTAVEAGKVKQGVTETELDFEGKKIKILTIYGLANARPVMELIGKGTCDAALVHIISCGGSALS